MIIIGVDFHPEFRQIASVDTDTGEFQEKRLGHREDAEEFYRGLAAAGQKVRVGMTCVPAGFQHLRNPRVGLAATLAVLENHLHCFISYFASLSRSCWTA